MFTDIGTTFEQDNPGVTVTFNFDPPTVWPPASTRARPSTFRVRQPHLMDAVQDEGLGPRAASQRQESAGDHRADRQPGRHEGFDDLAEGDVKLLLAAEGVLAGDYARETFGNAGTADAALANVVSNEEDVKSVVTKVVSGDADRGSCTDRRDIRRRGYGDISRSPTTSTPSRRTRRDRHRIPGG